MMPLKPHICAVGVAAISVIMLKLVLCLNPLSWIRESKGVELM